MTPSEIARPGRAPSTAGLVAASHGTRDEEGRRQVAALVEAVRESLPGVPVVDAFVDVQDPTPGEAITLLERRGREAVVVPLLLSAGYHVYVDLTRAVDRRPGSRLAPALGPDERLVGVLADRVRAVDDNPSAVVLAAAGSSDERSVADCRRVAADLGVALGVPVHAAFLSAAAPTVVDAVERARAELRNGGAAGGGPPGRVVVASYLLAPGFFQTSLRESASRVGAPVTEPLLSGAHPDARLVELVVDRFGSASPT